MGSLDIFDLTCISLTQNCNQTGTFTMKDFCFPRCGVRVGEEGRSREPGVKLVGGREMFLEMWAEMANLNLKLSFVGCFGDFSKFT